MRFSSSGVHRFDILPNQAYDHIHPRLARIAAIAAQPALVYFGTLAQRADSHRALRQYAAREPAASDFSMLICGLPVLHVPRMHWSLKQADILKANEEELELMGELLDLAKAPPKPRPTLMRTYLLKGVLITRGAEGAWWLDHTGWTKIPCAPLNEICDTVGAGDAFSAVFMLGLLHGWSIPLTMQRAHRLAGAVCGYMALFRSTTISTALSSGSGFRLAEKGRFVRTHGL